MSAVYGAWLLGFATVAFAWAYGQYRRPQPAAWTDWGSISSFVVLTVIGAAAMGAGFLVRAIAAWDTLSFGFTEIGLIALAFAAVVPAVRILARPARHADANAVANPAATVHSMARRAPEDLTEAWSVLPPHDPTKPGHSRKAA